jgi:hypothetical protein
MSVRTYYKKPEKIRAIQWTGDNLNEVSGFVGECLGPIERRPDYKLKVKGKNCPTWFWVDVDKGDYITLNESGEFHVKTEKWFWRECELPENKEQVKCAGDL